MVYTSKYTNNISGFNDIATLLKVVLILLDKPQQSHILAAYFWFIKKRLPLKSNYRTLTLFKSFMKIEARKYMSTTVTNVVLSLC